MNLFLGTKYASGLTQLNKKDSITAGNYDAVDVLVNNKLFKRMSVQFIKDANSSEVYPCLSDELLTAVGVELGRENSPLPKNPMLPRLTLP